MSELEAVDAACGASAVGFDYFEDKEDSQSVHFHGSIFIPPYYATQFCNHTTLNFHTQESLKAYIAVNERLHHNAITKGNKTGASGSKDSEGNESVQVYIQHTEKSEDGQSSATGKVQVEASKDDQGNTNWKTTFSIEGEF